MKICWKYPDGKNGFCLTIPGGFTGIGSFNKPPAREASTPMPGVYPELLADASLVHAVHYLAKSAADKELRAALEGGVKSALQVLHTRGAAGNFSVSMDEES